MCIKKERKFTSSIVKCFLSLLASFELFFFSMDSSEM